MIRFTCILWIVCFPMVLWAQDQMLKTPLVEIMAGNQYGAAILVGNKEDTLYFVTAFHIVVDTSNDLTVYFYPDGTLQSPAEIVKTSPRFDLAVIQCARPTAFQVATSYSLHTSPPVLRQEVTVIGHPSGDPWMLNFSNRVNGLEYEGDDRYFTIGAQGLAVGNSGGPVLDDQNRLLGMMQELDARKGICLSSEQIRRSLQSWDIPIHLLSGIGYITPDTDTTRSQTFQDYTDPYLGIEMVHVPGGTFSMGSRSNSEQPIHRVQVADFYMGKYEVTQVQWRKVMGSNPSDNKNCDRCPVENVSWDDIQVFLRRLNARSPYTYRLPAEAEWEYAAGGGTEKRTKYPGTNDASLLYVFMNFCDVNCDGYWKKEGQNDRYALTAPVGKYLPNSLGLHDMSGNVWEWCEDFWHDSYLGAPTMSFPWVSNADRPDRIIRGGSYRQEPYSLRVAMRANALPTKPSHVTGFRLARTP